MLCYSQCPGRCREDCYAQTFYVDNFKTHINTSYELAPVNLLLGVNDSGKTNLLPGD